MSTRTDTSLTEAPKLTQSSRVVTDVWTVSGGRCTLCNKYLLQDDLTKQRSRLGEIAHIVARSPGGPRGNYPMPIENRNNINNLMLVCPEHHHIFDDTTGIGLVEQYPVELLREYKQKHEARIRYQTSLAEDSGTTVLRMLGNIRGNNVSVTPEEIRMATLGHAGLYPEYVGDETDIEINLQGLPVEVDDVYWTQGQRKIDEKIASLVEPRLERSEIKQISVFALARIPLLVYLGRKLSDKARIHVHQLQNAEPQGWVWHDVPAHDFEFKLEREGVADKVVLIVALSGDITIEMLPEQVAKHSIYSIRPKGTSPSRDLFAAKETVNAFRSTYQKVLRHVESSHGGADTIDLFVAAAAPACLVCGIERLPAITPDLLVYDRVGDVYKPILTIKNREN